MTFSLASRASASRSRSLLARFPPALRPPLPPAARAAMSEPALSPDRSRDRVRLRRRHLDCARVGRRGAPSRVAPRVRLAAHSIPRTGPSSRSFDAHGERRHLRAHARDRAVERVTFDDVSEQLDAWSRDGKWLYFSSGSQGRERNERHLPRSTSTAARRWRSAPTASRRSTGPRLAH